MYILRIEIYNGIILIIGFTKKENYLLLVYINEELAYKI